MRRGRQRVWNFAASALLLISVSGAVLLRANSPLLPPSSEAESFYQTEFSFDKNGFVTSYAGHKLTRPVPYLELSPYHAIPPNLNDVNHDCLECDDVVDSSSAVPVHSFVQLSSMEPILSEAAAFSFLEAAPQRENINGVLGRLAKYCKHQVPDTEWLICTENSNGTGYKAAKGSFGVALFATIVGGTEAQIEVLRDGALKLGARSVADVEWPPNSVIPLAGDTRIPVVMKSVFGGRTGGNPKTLGNKPLNALEKEIICNRFASSLRFGGTRIPLGPHLYDVFVTRSGRRAWHPYSTEGFLQQELAGNTAVDFMRELINNEQQSILDNIVRVFQRFTASVNMAPVSSPTQLTAVTAPPASPAMLQLKEEVSFLEAKPAAKAGGRPASTDSLAVPPLMTTDAWYGFRRACWRATRELWLRARTRMQLGLSIIGGLEAVWNGGMMHCDSHFANIFFTYTTFTSPEELIAAKKAGNVALPNYRIFLSDVEGCSSNEKTYLRKGMKVYPLDIAHMRWIDSARALPISELHKTAKRDKSSIQSIEAEIKAPCVTHRGMPEDLTEIMRLGLENLLGNYTTKRSFNLALSRIRAKAGTTFAVWENHRMRGDPRPTWSYLFEWMGAYLAEIGRVDQMLQATKAGFEKLATMEDCKLAWSIATRAKPRSDTPACTLGGIRQAVAEMKNILQMNYNLHFPNNIAAPPLRSPMPQLESPYIVFPPSPY